MQIYLHTHTHTHTYTYTHSDPARSGNSICQNRIKSNLTKYNQATEREFCVDNLLVRIHLIIEII